MVEKRLWGDLADEYWEMMLDRLNNDDDHRHLESVSLVSKQFLSITNRLRSHLNITDEIIQVHGSAFPKLLCRFHNLKWINFVRIKEDIHEFMEDIAGSGLQLEGLNISGQKKISNKLEELGAKIGKSLRVLKCTFMDNLYDRDIEVIWRSFPNLEDLDISFPGQERDFECACQE